MVPDLVQIRKLAERKENENFRFRRFLKECDLEAGEIDGRVFDITHRVWAGIDCTTCANCCRELRPTFSEDEVERVARRLGIEPDEMGIAAEERRNRLGGRSVSVFLSSGNLSASRLSR